MKTALAVALLVCSFGAGTTLDGHQQTPRLPRVSVSVDSECRQLLASADTVAELLDDLGIALGPLDRTAPAPQTPVTHGMHVRVTRVACRELIEETVLPSRTIVLADPGRPAGFTDILCHGEDGLLRRVWRIWEKDGEIASKTIVGEELLSEPTDTVVVRGTDRLPTRGGEWRNWRTPLMMEATAYDPGPRSCGKWANGYTATGVKAEKGIVAVDERVIPMGTRLYIPGYGFAVAADRGSAIKGMRIDLCFPTYEEAIRFGRRRLNVYLLD
jgi:3D (Asp-Asp-Asp) domain-containing protein